MLFESSPFYFEETGKINFLVLRIKKYSAIEKL